MALLRTLRPLNLLIIVLTMLLLEYFLLAPILDPLPLGEEGTIFITSRFHFALLILSTVLIAGAGNIINDYFDIRADRINKPEKSIIGKKLNRRTAMLVHFLFNGLALLIAAYISWRSGVWFVLLFQLFAAGVLWFYSVYLKHEPFVGNFMIALITAMIPILLLLFEFIPLYSALGGDLFDAFHRAAKGGQELAGRLKLGVFWILGYASFAFITTLIREIQKDLADQEGDERTGSRTMPVVMGERRTKSLTGGLFFLFFFALGFAWVIFLGDPYTLIYIFAGIALPAFISAFLMYGNGSRKRFIQASNWMKLTMLMGILFTIFATQVAPEGAYLP